MKLTLTSHMHAEAILRGDFATEFAEVLEVLEATQPPLYAPIEYIPKNAARGGPLKRQTRSFGGRKASMPMPINQSALNQELDRAFRQHGWIQQPFVDELRDRKIPSSLKGDFAKNRIFMEVEFGNIASMFRDLFKFHMASRTGDAEVAVLVVAKFAMAEMFDSGVATFEAAERLLPLLKIGIQIPICVVGLEPDDWQPIREAYEHMRNLCVAAGEECHDLDVAIRTVHEASIEDVLADDESVLD